MLPRKSTLVIREVAKGMELGEDMVDDVMSFYWHEVRFLLSRMSHTTISVDNFGKFEAREYMIDLQSLKFSAYLAKEVELMTYRQAIIRRDIEDQLNSLRRLKIMKDEEKRRKQHVKEKRHGKEKESGQHMEEQEAHP